MDLHYYAVQNKIQLLEHLDVALFPLSVVATVLAKRTENFKGLLQRME